MTIACFGVVRACCVFGAIAVPACAGFAQWTVTNLHPPGAASSKAYCIEGGRQGGMVQYGNIKHAAVWAGTAASLVDLHPTGAIESAVQSVGGSRQAGWVSTSTGVGKAALWNGTATSMVDLGLAGSDSRAFAIDGTSQVGSLGNNPAWASVWNGTSASWVNLNPPIATQSTASGAAGGMQVGWTRLNGGTQRAALWQGSRASWVDLHPSGATASWARATDGSQQVGWTIFNGVTYAMLWAGTAGSAVNLNPPGAISSDALGVHHGWQVGWVSIGGGGTRAAVWNGTGSSWEDLKALLPGSWGETQATGVWSDATTLYVAGWGISYDRARYEALLWTRPLGSCGTADFNGDGDVGTDSDIEAFFRCLAGTCCATCYAGGADFNADGDVGTDLDIEAFFRVLAGGAC